MAYDSTWYRSIVAILSEGEDISQYSFCYIDDVVPSIRKSLKDKYFLQDNVRVLWIDIQKNLRNKNNSNKFQNSILWILDIDFNKKV